MRGAVHEKAAALGQRALQRRKSFPALKTQEDTSVENAFFNDMRDAMYTQITEESSWSSKEEKSTT